HTNTMASPVSHPPQRPAFYFCTRGTTVSTHTAATEPNTTTAPRGRHANQNAGSSAPTDRPGPAGQHPQDIATTTPTPAPEQGAAPTAGSGGLPVSTVLLFLLGCVLLVIAALSLTRLNGWMNDYGAIPVFVAFFLVM